MYYECIDTCLSKEDPHISSTSHDSPDACSQSSPLSIDSDDTTLNDNNQLMMLIADNDLQEDFPWMIDWHCLFKHWLYRLTLHPALIDKIALLHKRIDKT
jgi:hypothetical protein